MRQISLNQTGRLILQPLDKLFILDACPPATTHSYFIQINFKKISANFQDFLKILSFAFG